MNIEKTGGPAQKGREYKPGIYFFLVFASHHLVLDNEDFTAELRSDNGRNKLPADPRFLYNVSNRNDNRE
ncbi:hypothetical protein [Caproicibacter sp.]|uniref:hypothetical protein n=1 Tax=Caproicibacter sp. TaxID=2814884 RepID=UPI003988B1C8